jgi:hypothetical protein
MKARFFAGLLVLQIFALPILPLSAAEKETTQATSESLPSPRQILEKFEQAIGGAEAFARHDSQYATGMVDMSAQGLKGTMQVFAARPNKMKMVVNIEGIGAITTAYDGSHGWISNPLTGPMLLDGKKLQQIATEADYDHSLHKPDDYKTMELLGKEQFAGDECYKLHLIHRSGFETIEYFSVKTGLQMGFVATEESPFGAMKSTSTVLDYKKFGQFLLPSRIVKEASGMKMTASIDKMEFDQVPASTFELPPDVKALLEGNKSTSTNSLPRKSAPGNPK